MKDRRPYVDFIDDDDTVITEMSTSEAPVIKTYPRCETRCETKPYFHAPTRIIFEVT